MFEQYRRAVLVPLQARRRAPAWLERQLSGAIVRLLNTGEIVSPGEAYGPVPSANGEQIAEPQPEMAISLAAIEDRISAGELAAAFREMLATFGAVARGMLTADQRERLSLETGGSRSLPFLMTDAGGPSVLSWRSVHQPETGELILDKRWIMVPSQGLRAAIALVRHGAAFSPRAYLISGPEVAQLDCRPVGAPLFGGAVQLSHVSGSLSAGAAERMNATGASTALSLLSILRPQLVRMLMANLLALEGYGRLRLTGEQAECVAWLLEAGRSMIEGTVADPTAEALALKFASNELLFTLVADSCFSNPWDARDALAATKMEGSSHACFVQLSARTVRTAPPSSRG